MANVNLKTIIAISALTIFATSATMNGAMANDDESQNAKPAAQHLAKNKAKPAPKSSAKASAKPSSKASINSGKKAKSAAKNGQNAFTRKAQKPLSGILTPVPNPHSTPCNSVVECRKYGGDLKTVWQVNNTTDYSPKNYPENCYVLGDNGKYVYSSAACR